MIKKEVVGFVLILTLFLVACSQTIGVECVNDKECTANKCCHADEAVSVENAPNCESVFCTMDCQPGTLDCGQGEVKCVNNKCEVRFHGG